MSILSFSSLNNAPCLVLYMATQLESNVHDVAQCSEFDHRVKKRRIYVFTLLYLIFNPLLFFLNTFLSSHRLNHRIKSLIFFLSPPYLLSVFFFAEFLACFSGSVLVSFEFQ